jgi:hypothetical protein
MDYTSIQLDAYNAIKDAGATLSLKVSTLGTYNPATDTFSTLSTYYHTFGVSKDYKQEEVDNTQVKYGDKRYIVPAYGLPRFDQYVNTNTVNIELNGQVLPVFRVKTLEPGGVALLYYFQVRP